MKKLSAVLAALVFALSCAAIAMAAEEKAPADTKAAPAAKPAEAKKDTPKKVKAQFVTGPIEAVDPAAGTLTVKGRKGLVNLKAGEKVKLEGLKKGERITVKYSADGTALSVMKPKAKKAEPKKDAAPAAPAATPADKK